MTANKVFISDLPSHFDEAATQQVFNAYGSISSLRMMPPRKEGDKAACIIDFTDAQEAQWIVTNLNGNIAEGLNDPVSVRFANASKGVGKAAPAPPAPQADAGKGWTKGGKGGKDGGAAAAANSGAGTWASNSGAGAATSNSWSSGASGGGGSWSGGNSQSWSSNSNQSWDNNKSGGEWKSGPQEGYGKAGKGAGSEGYSSSPYNGKGSGKKGGKDSNARALLDSVTKAGLLPDNGSRPEDQCVYIRGLPPDTTDTDIYRLFAVFGAIPPRGVKAMKHPDGTCTSIGFVDFSEPGVAQKAIEALNGYQLPDGKSLFLKTKNPAGSGKGGKDGKDGKGKQLKGDGGKGKSWAPEPWSAPAPPPPVPPPPAPARPAAAVAPPPAVPAVAA